LSVCQFVCLFFFFSFFSFILFYLFLASFLPSFLLFLSFFFSFPLSFFSSWKEERKERKERKRKEKKKKEKKKRQEKECAPTLPLAPQVGILFGRFKLPKIKEVLHALQKVGTVKGIKPLDGFYVLHLATEEEVQSALSSPPDIEGAKAIVRWPPPKRKAQT